MNIVFAGDIFRTQSGEANQLQNAFLLHELMSYPIFRATNIVPEIRHCGVGSSYGADWLRETYKEFGLEPSAKSWSRIFWLDKIPSRISEDIERAYAGSIVICFEMPPILEAILDRLRIPWINVCLSPLRFLPDLLFDFSFSAQFSTPALEDFILTQEMIDRSIMKVRDWAMQVGQEFCYQDSAVFFAQTAVDRTLIQKGGFIERSLIVESVRERVAGRRLFIKRHPWGADNPLVEDLISECGAQECFDNSYIILSSEDRLTAVTISSSVAREAPLFGKSVDTIYPDVINRQLTSSKIMGHYRFANFWRRVFREFLPVTQEDDTGLAWHYNLLRLRIGTISLPMHMWPPA